MAQTPKPKTVVFDSSGLVSLVKTDDLLHEAALQVAEQLAADGYRLPVADDDEQVNRDWDMVTGDGL